MFRLYFGSPGCGKTTFAVYQIYKDRIRKKPVYDYHFANFKCDIVRECSLKGLGTWTFPEFSYVACDESGVEFNSRRFKQMAVETMQYCKEHRHYIVDIDFFSQSWHDTDLVIRDLVEEVWHLKKIGPWTLARRIKKKVDIDEQTHKPDDMYYKLKMLRRFLPFPFGEKTFEIIYRPFYYKHFDTHERKVLPVRYFGQAAPDPKIPGRIENIIIKIKSVFVKTARPPESPEVEENSTASKDEERPDILNFDL